MHDLFLPERHTRFNPRSKSNGNIKSHFDQNNQGNSKPLNDLFDPNSGKRKKGKSKYGYYNQLYHLESSCNKNTIDLTTKELKQNNMGIAFPKKTRRCR